MSNLGSSKLRIIEQIVRGLHAVAKAAEIDGNFAL
jgi:hypothetical protein